jgi:hypothetical protein
MDQRVHASTSTAACALTVVVPTRNEAGNVGPLVERLTAALGEVDAEVVFVDDSDDDTPLEIAAIAGSASPGRITLLHREPGQRTGGLGGAVVAGLRVARGRFVCVIDGDMQHPPETVPMLLERANAADHPDLVVATRYAKGGESGLSPLRAAVSKASTRATRQVFPHALRELTDPMSGFFLVARHRLDVDALRPEGFKILVEIAVRSRGLRIAEVGYSFGARQWGSSKAGVSEGARYLRHVRRLRRDVRCAERTGTCSYDVHGIVTVVSDTTLPELEPFRVRAVRGRPTIRVNLQPLPPEAPHDDVRRPMRRHLRYRESLGNAGFAADVTVDPNHVEITASPVLRFSPHVLYTNLVEPVLRWTLVPRGFALAHGAVFVDGERAYMVTARTDTGKTTTMLKLLDAEPAFGFISDDLSIICPDGAILSFPKPMTISQHTVHAVKTPRLTRQQRATLGLQSRLHSREGRRFAFVLARTGLPVATINAFVQALVPPPKYPVGHLVPGVPTVREARLESMFVITRAEHDGVEGLAHDAALEILLANTDDAYGFPPYHKLEEFLLAASGEDLRALERGIIAGALEGHDAYVISSASMGWANEIPRLIDDGRRNGQVINIEERMAVVRSGDLAADPIEAGSD